MSLSLWATMAQPWFNGSGTSSDVPGLFPCALNGRPYMVDVSGALEGYGKYRLRREPLPVLRQQSDTSNQPGEHSVAVEQYWRRSMESWHHGAGQSVFDRDTSSPYRFRASKGVDCWTPWQLTLLHGTTQALASASSTVQAVTAGGYVYVADGTTVRRSADLSTWTALTGAPASAATSLCTDGLNVYVAFGANGIWKTSTAGTVLTSYVTGSVSLVGFVNNRLIADDGAGKLYNVTAGGAITAAALLLDRSQSGWTWSAIGAGQSVLYAAGYSGDKSAIYKTSIPADGTALAVPVVAATLPDGELVTAVDFYVGFVLVGTSKGVRLGQPDGAGFLTLGALIPTASAVRCFEGQDRFVWFGWTNYDTVSTGLGRFDPQTFPDPNRAPLAPAYASDLMVTGQGAVLSACTFGALRVFTVAGKGVYVEAATPLTTGTVSTGRITYGLGDDKVAVAADVRYLPMPTGGDLAVQVSTNSGALVDVGTMTAAGGSPVEVVLAMNEARGETFELALQLIATTAAPVVTRLSLRVRITPKQRPCSWTVPIILAREVSPAPGVPRTFDVLAELSAINDLFASGQVVRWQFGTRTYQVTVNNFTELPELLPGDGKDSARTLCVLELYEIGS